MIRLNLSQTLLLSAMLVGGIGFAQAESDLENATTKNLEASEARWKAAQAGAEHDKKKMKEMEEKAEQLEAEAKKMEKIGRCWIVSACMRFGPPLWSIKPHA
jgi:hypothetical protein